jgi:uncharacterized protein (DUF1800 family)
MIKQQAVTAVHRFGYAARPGELMAAQADPQGWLLSQLDSPRFDPRLGNTELAFRSLYAQQQIKKKQQQDQSANMDMDQAMDKGAGNPIRKLHLSLLEDSISQSVTTPQPFAMRLLDFFSNHFSVSASGAPMQALAPLLEREAIAPHLFGRFEDLLIAVEQHPAMLIYLNNEKSFGPDSDFARRRKKVGLNENLAREILELHTVGVDGGYQLEDIQQLAKAISGWSVARVAKDKSTGFMFRAAGHQPGARTIMGVRYTQSGVEQGESVLRDLARHPATARHVSFKLAQHLINDQPPAELVASMVKSWQASDGDLRQVVTALVRHPAAWQPQAEKYKTPREFVVSALRATGVDSLKPRLLVASLSSMGQQPFQAGSPAGFSPLNRAWLGADALIKRIDWVERFCTRLALSPQAVVEQQFAGQLSTATGQAIARAESRQQGLALLLLSPEFQRR